MSDEYPFDDSVMPGAPSGRSATSNEDSLVWFERGRQSVFPLVEAARALVENLDETTLTQAAATNLAAFRALLRNG